MKGEYHSLITIAYALAISLPFISLFGMSGLLPPFLFIWFIFTAGWASLVPDVDAPDARIFREYPQIAFIVQKLIYKPIATIIGEKKHRGITHSLEGAFLISILFFIYSFIAFLFCVIFALLVLPEAWNSFVSNWENVEDVPIDLIYALEFTLVTIGAIFFGIFCHLWEDSLTVSGIQPIRRSSRTMKGPVRVGGVNEERVAILMMGIGVILSLLELLLLRNQFILFYPLASITVLLVFIGLGFLIRSPYIMSFLGEDELIKDVKARTKAERNAFEFNHKGITYHVERDRVKRGLKLRSQVNPDQMKVGNYSLKVDSEGKISCNCRDFQKLGDLTICKHIVAFLADGTKKILATFQREIKS